MYEWLIENIQYSEKISDSSMEMRWVSLPRKHPLFVLEELSDYRSKMLEEHEWRGLGIKMSKGWIHCGYSPFEYNILVFKRPISLEKQD